MTYTTKLHLTSKDIHLEDVDAFLGKDVEIIIHDVEEQKPKKREWNYLGSLHLGKSLDDKNIRDLAYE